MDNQQIQDLARIDAQRDMIEELDQTREQYHMNVPDHDLLYLRDPTPAELHRMVELYGYLDHPDDYTVPQDHSDPCKTCVQAGTCLLTFGLCALLSPDEDTLMDEIDAQMKEEHQVEDWHEHCHYRDICKDAPEQCKDYCINRRTPPRFYERPNDETMDCLPASTCDNNMDFEPFCNSTSTSRPGYRELAKMIFAIVAGAIVAYVLLGR